MGSAMGGWSCRRGSLLAIVVLVTLVGAAGCRVGSDAAASAGAGPDGFCEAVVSFNGGYQAAEDRAARAGWSPAAVKLAYDEWDRLERGLLAAAPDELVDAQRVLVDGYGPVTTALAEVEWNLARVDPAVFDYSEDELEALRALNEYLVDGCAVPYLLRLGFSGSESACLAEAMNAPDRSLFGDTARAGVVEALGECGLPEHRADIWDY